VTRPPERPVYVASATQSADGWELVAEVDGQHLAHTVSRMIDISAVETEVATIIAYRVGEPVDSFDVRIIVN